MSDAYCRRPQSPIIKLVIDLTNAFRISKAGFLAEVYLNGALDPRHICVALRSISALCDNSGDYSKSLSGHIPLLLFSDT